MPIELTARAAAFVLHSEGMVLETYKDSVGVWTWAGGVTNASGHQVYPRYLDKPQSLKHCLDVTVWILRERYLPPVSKAFAGHDLSEAQVAAAISFQWNTGAILTASWVRAWKDGKPSTARASFMEWKRPASIIARRQSECDLFFDERWPDDLRCPIYTVAKPSHTPRWSSRQLIDMIPALKVALGEAR